MPLYNPIIKQAYSSSITGTMTTTSASIADLTVSGLSNAAIANINFPAVSIAAASSGWTFTPTSIGVLAFTAQVQVVGSANSNGNIVITDGSNAALCAATVSNLPTAGSTQTVTLSGFLNITSLSAVTLKVRGSITAGTMTVNYTYIAMNYL